MNTIDFDLLRYDPSIELSTKNRETVKIDIHTVKRTGKKHITRVSNLHYHLDIPLKQFLKHCRDSFSCGGNIVKEIDDDNEVKEVLQLQGYHKENVRSLLTSEYDINIDNIIERGL